MPINRISEACVYVKKVQRKSIQYIYMRVSGACGPMERMDGWMYNAEFSSERGKTKRMIRCRGQTLVESIV